MKSLSDEKIMNTIKPFTKIEQLPFPKGLDPLSNSDYIIKKPESKYLPLTTLQKSK